MSKVFAVTALAAAAFVALAAAASVGAQPVANEHEHFVSDPYDDSWCGIDGTSVSSGVAHYLEDASGRSVETLNVTTLFTATDTGKTIEIRETGARLGSGPIDNGDGTFSLVFTNVGQSPSFMIPNGPPLVLDVGLVQFLVTFDSASGDFLSFEVAKLAGQRPPGCDAVVAYLTDP